MILNENGSNVGLRLSEDLLRVCRILGLADDN